MILSALASSIPGSFFSSALLALLMSTGLILAAEPFALASLPGAAALALVSPEVAGLPSAAMDRLANDSNAAATIADVRAPRFTTCLLMLAWGTFLSPTGTELSML